MIRLIIIAGLVLAGCTPKRDSIPLIREDTEKQVITAADAHAKEIGGQRVYVQGPTTSMAPTSLPGDYLVVDTGVLFDDIKQGWLASYRPNWHDTKVVHWVSEKSGDEWIMDGENNRSYERGFIRLRREHFEALDSDGVRRTGRVVGIYRVRGTK